MEKRYNLTKDYYIFDTRLKEMIFLDKTDFVIREENLKIPAVTYFNKNTIYLDTSIIDKKDNTIYFTCKKYLVPVKELYSLKDFSYLKDENFKEAQGFEIFGWGFKEGDWPLVEIVEENLKIPVKRWTNKTIYLDTMIKYDDTKYFTCRSLLEREK